jgi:hypothetical protein
MGVAQWMRVLDTVSGLVQMSGRFRRGPDTDLASSGPGTGPLGQLETRLAGVVVAALKEAFDRDRVRMDLERAQMDAERLRAEEALRAELRRQAGERALGQLRLIAMMAVGIWMLSAALGVLVPGLREAMPKVLLGAGWGLSIGALGCAFIAWQYVSTWSADTQAALSGIPSHAAAKAAPWLLLASLALIGTSLLLAL